jgi:indoleamine 2,3-dioxygenase
MKIKSSRYRNSEVERLDNYKVSSERGFLPSPDPLDRLSREFTPWETMAHDLPKFLVTGKVRTFLKELPLLNAAKLKDDRERNRAMVILSFLGHGYVWGEPETIRSLPACLAVPWYEVARRLGRPPVLSYASYALENWRRFDINSPIELGNIVLLQNFLGGRDEEWFVLIHVAIEAMAGRALAAITKAQEAVARDEPEEVAAQLSLIAAAMEEMYKILLRMPEHCDPYIYYNRVRPYIHGWKHHPAVSEGIIYEGVGIYRGRPQKFRGETGAQSSIVPSLDAALGVEHERGLLYDYLMEMRDYMPPQHRNFIAAIERGPSIRRYVLYRRSECRPLPDVYNDCIHGLALFRSTHLDYAETYIQKQSQQDRHNPVEVGTGGTPFVPYLKKHIDETARHRIE